MIEKFLRRMEGVLPDYSAYVQCLKMPAYKGLRVNTLKLSAEEFKRISQFPLKPVAWEENGFSIDEEKPGRSLYHDAGLYYVQEPSAMCAAPLLDVQPGDRVLDLCSAPGGKGTQLAQKMQGKGILVLNEKIPDRARVLLQNVERLGVRNAVVTCADPESLAEKFSCYFDKILVDAPCSGEGMFRKEPSAAEQWSEENVTMCAARQKKILVSAEKMLAPGGRLVYSTCTFSEEEDEENVAWLKQEMPWMRLLEQKKIWPHRAAGEGHFAALFEKEEGEQFLLRSHKFYSDKKAENLYRAYEKDFMKESLNGKMATFGNSLFLLPEDLFSLDGLRVLRAGVKLGDCIPGKTARFEPAHALVMSVNREAIFNKVSLSEQDARKYLQGQELPASDVKGWCAVLYEGWPLGLAKGTGMLKNHYPKGLRHGTGTNAE